MKSLFIQYLSNFWRFPDLLLINSEIEFDLSCIKNYVLIGQNSKIACVNVMITSTKLYVPVVTLSFNDNIKFLKNIKQELKKTQIYPWNNKISKKK